MPERPVRTIDHVVHAVDDLDEAATAYEGLGFTVTPRADHPFGTSNRLVVLQDTYIEIVSVTDPQRIPTAGFAAGVTSRLRERGSGISHVVLSSSDPASDLAELGPLATGEIFSFSRPAPQVDGTEVQRVLRMYLRERHGRPRHVPVPTHGADGRVERTQPVAPEPARSTSRN